MIQNRKTRKPERFGFTLSELFVSMVIGSALMVLTIGVLQKSFRWSTASRHRVAVEQSFDRLQRQFRSDVHFASEANFSENTLQLKVGDQSVTYQIEGDSLTRVQQSAENVTHNDRYEFHGMNRAEFSQLEHPDRAVLRTYKQTQIKDPSRVPVWRDIQAVRGFSLRHREQIQ